MKSLLPKCFVLALLYCLLLTSCNGGGGSSVAGGGIDGTGIMSAGMVSAFGSIFVNGTEFDTSNAAVIINGEEIGVGDDVVGANLQIGMVVTVEGRIKADGSAIADRVAYSANVIGPVESISSIDATTKEIVVLGQTVIANVITKFAPDSYGFDSLAMGDVVEVSGYLDDNRVVRATFVAESAGVLEFEVTGFVENLNTRLKIFEINDLIVDYSSINSRDLPEDFTNDSFVEVAGEIDGANGEMIASAIELADELDAEDGDEVEIMGFVTEITSENDIIEFKVGNQVVQVDPDSAVFVDGDPDGIAPGQKLEAEGDLVEGILIAYEVEFWKPDQIEIEGIVTEVVSDTEFRIEQKLVQTDGDTIFEPEDLLVDNDLVGLVIEIKGVPQDLEQSIIEADKVSYELE